MILLSFFTESCTVVRGIPVMAAISVIVCILSNRHILAKSAGSWEMIRSNPLGYFSPKAESVQSIFMCFLENIDNRISNVSLEKGSNALTP